MPLKMIKINFDLEMNYALFRRVVFKSLYVAKYIYVFLNKLIDLDKKSIMNS